MDDDSLTDEWWCCCGCLQKIGGFDFWIIIFLMGKYSRWSKEEDQILMEVISWTKSKKWIKTSLKLKQKHYYRTPSECRERFINYLAPGIDKSEITDEELQIIYQKYEKFGPKWSIIQQYLRRKTQCKIKNVFYGNIKNLLKTVYKFFTLKTAPFINSISTDFLHIIYDGCLEFDGMHQTREGIQAMNYRNNKSGLFQHIMKDRERYLLLINTVLRQIFHEPPIKDNFNETHQKRILKLLRQEQMRTRIVSAHKKTVGEVVKQEDSVESQGEDEGSEPIEKDGNGMNKMVKIETDDASIKVQAGQERRTSPVPSNSNKASLSFQDIQNTQNTTINRIQSYPIIHPYFPFPYYYPSLF